MTSTASSAIFDDLDADSTATAGELFTDLIARYLAETRDGNGAVSTSVPPEEIARRFDVGRCPARA